MISCMYYTASRAVWSYLRSPCHQLPRAPPSRFSVARLATSVVRALVPGFNASQRPETQVRHQAQREHLSSLSFQKRMNVQVVPVCAQFINFVGGSNSCLLRCPDLGAFKLPWSCQPFWRNPRARSDWMRVHTFQR